MIANVGKNFTVKMHVTEGVCRSVLKETAHCQSSLMLNCNGILMETCKNYFKIIEFKVMGHLRCSLVNKSTRKDKD